MTEKNGAPLVKTYDGEHASKEREQATDDAYDILMSDIQGRTEVGDGNRIEDESDARAERLFFEAVGVVVGERCKEWLGKKIRIQYDGHGTGYIFDAYDREGRQFQVTVSYSEMSAVAALQRQADKNLEAMAGTIADKLNKARKFYHERLRAAEIALN